MFFFLDPSSDIGIEPSVLFDTTRNYSEAPQIWARACEPHYGYFRGSRRNHVPSTPYRCPPSVLLSPSPYLSNHPFLHSHNFLHHRVPRRPPTSSSILFYPPKQSSFHHFLSIATSPHQAPPRSASHQSLTLITAHASQHQHSSLSMPGTPHTYSHLVMPSHAYYTFIVNFPECPDAITTRSGLVC